MARTDSTVDGTFLKQYRTLRHAGDPVLSQAQAATWAGISERTWRRYENSGRVPLWLTKRIRQWAKGKGGLAAHLLTR